jgi:LemA protein
LFRNQNGQIGNATFIILGVVGLIMMVGLTLSLWVMGVNNRLVRFDQIVSQRASEVQNIYQLRHDLVGNLVETVKGYAGHERGTLTDVIAARASATSIRLTPEALKDPEAVKRFEAAQSSFAGALSRLMVTVERYPDLKADKHFLNLQKSLAQIEVKAVNSRSQFNQSVLAYNTQVKTFPGNLVAGFFGYTPKAFFEGAKGIDIVPKVNFSTGK